MQTVRTVVIGAGGIANAVHLPSLKQIHACRITAVCDLVEARARQAADTYAVPAFYTDYHRMLDAERPDAVFVLVRPDEAFRVALDCLRAGCHVMVEKPPGVTRYQAETLARTADAQGKHCQVGFNRRFIPLMTRVLRELRETGDIHQIDGWFFKSGDAAFYDGGISALACDAIHTIDLIRYIAKSDPADCATVTARYGDTSVKNAWNSVILFQNGITGTLRANYQTGGRVHGLALHTSAASAYINMGFGGEACEAQILYSVQGTFSLSAGGRGEQRITCLDGKEIAGSNEYYRYYGYFDEDDSFIRALAQGKPVSCGIVDALQTMSLVEMLPRKLLHR